MSVGVVVNPFAGGGRLERIWPEIEVALERRFGHVEVARTKAPREACGLARGLALGGAELVVAVGGDGTASEVADGLLQAFGESGRRADLALLPCGTGVDFARGFGIPENSEAAVARIADAQPRSIDAGRICYIDDHGALASRHFVNIAGLGLSGAIARAVNADRRKGRGSAKALFLWHTVRTFLRYRFQNVRITVDDGEAIDCRMALVAVANGKYFGGGMMIAPDAVLDDGAFEVVILRAASKLKLLLDLRLVYGGRHRDHPAITILRGRKVAVEPLGDPLVEGALVDVDGEAPGRIPATFELLPGALGLRC